jgi:drug/metabolite transporter (DMT)-like permease
MTPRSEPLRVHAALAAVSILFSINYILAKVALAEIEPFAFAWLRVAGSTLLLQCVVRLRGSTPLPRSDWPRAIVYSILGVVLNQLMFITGLSMTSAHEAAILITTIPIFTLVAAVALRIERASLFALAGILLAGAGALLIIGPSGLTAAGQQLLGNSLILLNCASYAFYLVVSRPLLQRTSAISAMSLLFAAGTVILFPFCLPALLRLSWSSIGISSWLALAGVIAGPTVAAYVLNAWALARAESSLVAAYTYVQPFLAAILAALILDEELHVRVFAAAVLIIAGVAITTFKGRMVVLSDGVGDSVSLEENERVNETGRSNV